MNFSKIVFILYLVVYFGHWGFVLIILGTCSLCVSTMLHKHSHIKIGVCTYIYFSPTISSKHEFNEPHWLPFQVSHCATLLDHFMNTVLVGIDNCSFRSLSMLCSLTTSFNPTNLILVIPIRYILRPVTMQLVIHAGISEFCITAM